MQLHVSPRRSYHSELIPSLTTALRYDLHSLPLAQKWGVVLVPDIPSPIRSIIELDVREAVTHPGKPITRVHDIIVIVPKLGKCLHIAKSASGPECRYTAGHTVTFVPRAAVLGPDGALHEFVGVLDEVFYGVPFRSE